MFNMKVNTLLLTDFYKCCHMNMYDPKICSMTSYLVPRGSRLPGQQWVMQMGLVPFIKKYLVEDFNESFFKQNWKNIESQYYEVMTKSLGYKESDVKKTCEKVKKLHDLGYLPVRIKGVPEGTKVPMGVPCIEIKSTKSHFAWVSQALESLLSSEIWHPMISATIAYRYLELAKEYSKYASKDFDYKKVMCDFSMRGQESMESAINASVAWLSCFKNSSTVPARAAIMQAYPKTENLEVYGLTSTEHSVMTTDYAINGNERETYRKLLTEIYPEASFATVCDSYDFWNVLTNVLPTLKEEINNHKGFMGVRHDSADPVKAICGIPRINMNEREFFELIEECIDPGEPLLLEQVESDIILFEDMVSEFLNEKENAGELPSSLFEDEGNEIIVTITADQTKSYVFNVYVNPDDEAYEAYHCNFERVASYEDRGMVDTMYELFGGTVNDKGFKVMNPHLKAVYGDSITIHRANNIFERLTTMGYSIENVSLGVGSFSFEAFEDDYGKLYPFTRDTFSIAIKCTHATIEDENGEEKPIYVYKDPKNFSGKKSHKGLCYVFRDTDTRLYVEDGYLDEEAIPNKRNMFIEYFYNGKINPEVEDFNNVRQTIDYQFNVEY